MCCSTYCLMKFLPNIKLGAMALLVSFALLSCNKDDEDALINAFPVETTVQLYGVCSSPDTLGLPADWDLNMNYRVFVNTLHGGVFDPQTNQFSGVGEGVFKGFKLNFEAPSNKFLIENVTVVADGHLVTENLRSSSSPLFEHYHVNGDISLSGMDRETFAKRGELTELEMWANVTNNSNVVFEEELLDQYWGTVEQRLTVFPNGMHTYFNGSSLSVEAMVYNNMVYVGLGVPMSDENGSKMVTLSIEYQTADGYWNRISNWAEYASFELKSYSGLNSWVISDIQRYQAQNSAVRLKALIDDEEVIVDVPNILHIGA